MRRRQLERKEQAQQHGEHGVTALITWPTVCTGMMVIHVSIQQCHAYCVDQNTVYYL